MHSLNNILNLLGSIVASSLRLWGGTSATLPPLRPQKTLELYDMEGCPCCRLVREALTELDLEVMLYPCPKGGARFIGRLEELGGKHQVPYLVDPHTGVEMFESKDMGNYSWETYG